MSSGPAALPFFHLFEGLFNFLLKTLGAFIVLTTGTWSPPKSAPGEDLHDVTVFRNRSWNNINSIWFRVLSPGLFHAQHLLGWFLHQVFITVKWCSLQNSISLSPLSFYSPIPKGPIIFSVLSPPTFELKSPITISMSSDFTCSIALLAVSWKISTSLSSLSAVDAYICMRPTSKVSP